MSVSVILSHIENTHRVMRIILDVIRRVSCMSRASYFTTCLGSLSRRCVAVAHDTKENPIPDQVGEGALQPPSASALFVEIRSWSRVFLIIPSVPLIPKSDHIRIERRAKRLRSKHVNSRRHLNSHSSNPAFPRTEPNERWTVTGVFADNTDQIRVTVSVSSILARQHRKDPTCDGG